MEHFESPFGPGDFTSARAIENFRFFGDLSNRAREHRYFAHPFMVAFDRQPPTRDQASFVLTSVYKLVSPFTGLLCSLGGRAPDLRSRFALMDNIFEEMGCGSLEAAHPSLFLKMLASIGVTAEEAERMATLPAIRKINEHLREVVERRPFAVACGVLASAEWVIPPTFPVFASMATRAFPHIDMTFFDRHGPRDEGHSDDAAMLFAVTADREQFDAVEHEVMLDLEYRCDLFDEWVQAMNEGTAQRRSRVTEHPRPLSVRPPMVVSHPSAPPPALSP